MVLDYTANMGRVDLADQWASTYCFLRRSLKWWRKLFLLTIRNDRYKFLHTLPNTEEGKQHIPQVW